MKKLIYKENTNIINIIDQEDLNEIEKDIIDQEDLNEIEKKKINCIKEKLENSKIFFEVFSYVCIGIMGVVISVVGNNINKKIWKYMKGN